MVRRTGKEKADDIPSWAVGKRPAAEESGRAFAERVLVERYGGADFARGPGSEYNKLQKYGDRSNRGRR